MKYSLYNNNNLCILHGQVFVMCGKKLRRSIIPWHKENMSVKCVPLQTPHLYSKTGVCKGIPIFLIFAPKHRLWVLGEAVLSCTHNLCFEQKQEKIYKKVQVGKDQEKAQSEKDSHSKNRGGKKTKLTIRYLYHETIVSRMGSYFPNRWPLSYLNLTKNMKTYIRRQQHKKFLNTKT